MFSIIKGMTGYEMHSTFKLETQQNLHAWKIIKIIYMYLYDNAC